MLNLAVTNGEIRFNPKETGQRVLEKAYQS